MGIGWQCDRLDVVLWVVVMYFLGGLGGVLERSWGSWGGPGDLGVHFVGVVSLLNANIAMKRDKRAKKVVSVNVRYSLGKEEWRRPEAAQGSQIE